MGRGLVNGNIPIDVPTHRLESSIINTSVSASLKVQEIHHIIVQGQTMSLLQRST